MLEFWCLANSLVRLKLFKKGPLLGVNLTLAQRGLITVMSPPQIDLQMKHIYMAAVHNILCDQARIVLYVEPLVNTN